MKYILKFESSSMATVDSVNGMGATTLPQGNSIGSGDLLTPIKTFNQFINLDDEEDSNGDDDFDEF